jgi:acyl-coenzyme A thioesterase PaaI-like protein
MVELPRVKLNTDMNEGLCFGCGRNNPIGLKLVFTREGEGVRAEFTPDTVYQGWSGVVHGGIVACMLDEAMSHAAYHVGAPCLTASMAVRLRKPCPINELLIITGTITKNRRMIIETKATICLKDGTVIAESTAKQFIIENNIETGNSQERDNASAHI